MSNRSNRAASAGRAGGLRMRSALTVRRPAGSARGRSVVRIGYYRQLASRRVANPIMGLTHRARRFLLGRMQDLAGIRAD